MSLLSSFPSFCFIGWFCFTKLQKICHVTKVLGKTHSGTMEKQKELHSYDCNSSVGSDGFEPPKLEAADLQSAPFGHSGNYPVGGR